MNSDSIKAKLKNIAVKEGKSFDYLLTLYLIERLLYRISISEYADKFVLKGGVLLYIVLEEKARATKDIDMLARQLNNSLKAMGHISSVENQRITSPFKGNTNSRVNFEGRCFYAKDSKAEKRRCYFSCNGKEYK